MKANLSQLTGRIALRLDVAIAFEALILTRLAQIPAPRREEWLRGLLIRGFQNECLSLKAISSDDKSDEPPRPSRPAELLPAVPDQPIEVRAEGIEASFAALRKVIG